MHSYVGWEMHVERRNLKTMTATPALGMPFILTTKEIVIVVTFKTGLHASSSRIEVDSTSQSSTYDHTLWKYGIPSSSCFLFKGRHPPRNSLPINSSNPGEHMWAFSMNNTRNHLYIYSSSLLIILFYVKKVVSTLPVRGRVAS